MAKIYNDITETIGNTPLVRLNRTAAAHGAQAEILLKLGASSGAARSVSNLQAKVKCQCSGC